MAVTVSLGVGALGIEPGGTVATDVTVRNVGDAAATVRLQVAGPGRPFSYIVPDTLTVEPGAEAAARVGFRVPRTSTPAAGPLAFEVRVDGQDGPAASGVIDVQPFSSLSISLDPSEASDKGPVQYKVSLANRGNAPVEVALTATGADGVDVRIDPPTVTVGTDRPAAVTVDVAPLRKLFTGDERETPFKILATPAVGEAIDVGGRYRQQVAVAAKKLVTSGVVAGVAVLGLILAVTVFAGGSSKSSSSSAATATTAADAGPLNACPSKGHEDTYVSGQRPEDIPKLPNSYSFLFTKSDGCSPVRFNPCEPLHYVQNVAQAPPGGPEDVRTAFRMLSEATGITFIDDGTTDERVRGRSQFLPDRYGPRWAPILVSWISFGNQGSDPAIQAVGRGIGSRVGDVLVSGQLSLNIDAITNSDTRAKVQPGFGPTIGSGVGAIGHDAVQWGRVILHELAHVMGLGHTRDKGAIMYPETADQTSRPAEYRPPDREGLRYLGREAGCLTTPTPA